MNTTSSEIAQAIAAHAEQAGQTVDQHLATEQARDDARHRELTSKPARPATIKCQPCCGTGTTEVIYGGWEHPKTRPEKCEHCDDDGRVLCSCGQLATVEISAGNFYCGECLAQDWAAGFEALVLKRLS